MAGKNKIIKFKDSDGLIMTINTKRLDAVYVNGRTIHFMFRRRGLNTGEYNTREAAEKIRSEIVKEWQGLS